MKAENPFNIRVYGILINRHNELLLSDEKRYGQEFTKLPGGGLNYGEGLHEALIREFKEECNADIEIVSHFYTTDFFVPSAFDKSQVISIYYCVKSRFPLTIETKSVPFDFDGQHGDDLQSFRWANLDTLRPEQMTFVIDRHVVQLLLEEHA